MLYGCPYRGIVWADGRLAFKFADPHNALRALEATVRAGTAPPVQARDLMRAYFSLRADLAHARAAQERRQGTTRSGAGAPGDQGGC